MASIDSPAVTNAFVFIDGSLDNLDMLLAAMRPDTRVLVLDPARDGLGQIASALAGYSGLDAIHIISHGSAGSLRLGNGMLDTAWIAGHTEALANIGNALSASGDLLLYGCDVAAGQAGQAFIAALGAATGADVAASTDLTGAALLRGNWVLEAATGTIEAQSIVVNGYQAVFANSTGWPEWGYATFSGDDYASAAPVSTQTDNVTLEGWVNWNGGGSLQVLFYNGNSGFQGYGVLGTSVGGHLALSGLAGGVAFMPVTDANIAADEWHHVALTRGAGVFHFYLDGVEKTIGNSGVNPIGAGGATVVGGNGNENFYGSISDVRLWNVARSATQIADARSTVLAGNETGLVGDWRFNDGHGSIATDSAGTQQNLTLSGTPQWGHDTPISTGAVNLADIAAGNGGFVIHSQNFQVASAGDINGDGFDDLVIGAPNTNGAGSPRHTVTVGSQQYPQIYNGSVFVSFQVDGSAGESYVVFGKGAGFGASVELSAIGSGSAGFVINGERAYDVSGYSVATAGDVNGDGFDDLIIGAPGADGAGAPRQVSFDLIKGQDSTSNYTYSMNITTANGSAGRSYVVYGKGAGFGTINLSNIAAGSGGFVINGQDSGDNAGRSVGSAGDLNGDGFDDLIVGAPHGDAAGNTRPDAGDTYVIFGQSGNAGTAVNLANVAAGTGGFVIRGAAGGDQSGLSVASAGDFNHDGFADLIIGAPNALGTGASYLVYGKASGFAASLDLGSVAAGTGGFVVVGQDGGDQAGRSVASAGDVNGDGYDDLVIGAPSADGSGNARADAGDAYVIFGRAGSAGSAINLAGVAAGSGGFVIHGLANGDQSGLSVAAAGDINNDGYADLIIGAPNAQGTGASYVVLGRAGGFGASVDLAAISAGIGGFVINGQGGQAGFSVAAAGDVNGDGFDDLIVGAPAANSSYVIFGRNFTAAVTQQGTTGADSLAGTAGGDVMIGGPGNDTLDGGAGIDSMSGGTGDDTYIVDSTADVVAENPEEGTDRVLSSATYTLLANLENLQLTGSGDINGSGNTLANALTGNGGNNSLTGFEGNDTLDGGAGNDTLAGGTGDDTYVVDSTADVVVENPGAGTDTVFASATTTLSANVENLQLTGTANINGSGNALANSITGNSGDNILTGGTGDTLDGGAGNDTLHVADLSFGQVAGGSGTDTLAPDGASLSLNLTQIAAGHIAGIEAIDLTGIGNNGVAFNAAAILALSDTSDTLRIDGNAGDRATPLDVGWVRGATASGYTTYTNGQATVQVASAVNFAVVAPMSLANVAAGSGGFVIRGVGSGDASGFSVAAAGDVNGDGYDDLIIGARNAGGGSGESYLVFGRAGGFGTAIDLANVATDNGGFVIPGEDGGDQSGTSVAAAGDLNGDGFDDLIIAAPHADGANNAKADAGDTYVLLGKADGFAALAGLTDVAAGSGGFVIHGRNAGDLSGMSVASAGDINGDGFDDLVIGAPNANGGAQPRSFSVFNYYGQFVGTQVVNVSAGESYVVFGKSTGFGTAIDLASIAAGSGGIVINGQHGYDRAGYSVACAGDVNGDGFGDLIIGAPGADGTGLPRQTHVSTAYNSRGSFYYDRINATDGNAGAAYVVYGKGAGFGTAINLGDVAAGNGGFVIDGTHTGDNAGRSVASAGDLNGDGFADLIVGAPFGDAAANAKPDAGDSYVIFGQAGTSGSPVSLASIAAGSGGLVIRGLANGDQSGLSVASAGDLNGDGYDDLIIGAPGAQGAGASYVAFGKAGGFANGLDLASIGVGIGGFVINGQNTGDQAGFAVAAAGDINGDGFDDLIVGAPTANNSYVIFGRDFTTTVTQQGTTGADNLAGTVEADIMIGDLGNDTLGGGLGNDALQGGAGNDLLAGGAGADTLDGGGGTDTATYANSAAGVTVNLVTNLNSGGDAQGDKFSGIENLTGSASGDTLTGDAQANLLSGLAGDDTLMGGAGNDTLDGAAGNDNLDGGAGIDLATFAGASAGVTVNLAVTTAQNTGGAGIDTIVNIEQLQGSAFNDALIGNGGDNTLEGGAGNDTLDGGNGIDRVSYAHAGAGVTASLAIATAQITSGAGTDTLANFEQLEGSAFNDALTGSAGNDSLIGGNGDDTLNGGAGTDLLDGGAGNDLLSYAGAASAVTINLATGTVGGAATGDIISNFEQVQGGDFGDSLSGGAGNDTLDGGTGVDTLAGSAGDDTYVVDSGSDQVNEAFGEGFDTIRSSVTYTLRPNVERLVLTGVANINGTGNALDNILIGNSSNNVLSGGAGNDTYVVDASDTVIELASAGIDTIQSAVTLGSLAANVESLQLTGTGNSNGVGNALANALTGNSGNNSLAGGDGNDTLDGGTGTDTLDGGAGNDTFVVDTSGDTIIDAGGIDTVASSISFSISTLASIENISLTGNAAINAVGNALANLITGNSADNILEGAAGADTLAGGAGNDTYVVDNAGDVIVENAGEGIDTVLAAINYVLASGATAKVENLTLTGSATTGTGNDLDNLVTGNAANNTLDGGAGADTLVGGTGNDTYVVDNPGDVVSELTSQGIDTVRTSLASYILPDHVEALILTSTTALNGTGNTLPNTLTGNTQANDLDGGIGADTMVGGKGDDFYHVDNPGDVITEKPGEGNDTVFSTLASYTLPTNVETLILEGTHTDLDGNFTDNLNGTGNFLSNIIYGNAGNNVIDGGLFVDVMIGAQGNDTYVVDSPDDIVIENAAEGTDAILSSVSYTLPDNVENLSLTGSGNIDGTGNALANIINGNAGNNVLSGLDGADTLAGTAGNDSLDGGSDNDLLGGGQGNDTLDGGVGADTMVGGDGNDTYRVDDVGDVVTESIADNPATTGVREGGSDIVESALLAYTLGNNVENLLLTGDANADGTGNSLSNQIIGNGANNHLYGLDGDDLLKGNGGADTLTGGTGNDTYYVDSFDDVVVELAGGGTADTVYAVGGADLNGFVLPDFVENINYFDINFLYAVGNGLNNFFTGNDGDNTLDGGAGADTMAGGKGDDTYIVDNFGDRAVEIGGEGTDLVMASVDYTIGVNVENLTLTGSAISGTGNSGDNLLKGTAANNVLNGSSGNDTASYEGAAAGVNADLAAGLASGGAGNDVLISIENLKGSGYNDSLAGNALDNDLEGGAGADTLAGGVGNDTMAGGSGGDTYYVDDIGDSVVETDNIPTGLAIGIDLGSVIDSVIASISYTLTAFVENLNLKAGAGTIAGTGNGLDNLINGNEANNLLTGLAGNDSLFGGDGFDTLIGGDGNDSLSGMNQADSISGGNGDDFLGGGKGLDTLDGGAGNDTVQGGLGGDVLTGGIGADRFIFSSALDGTVNVDTITDFTSGTDLIQLSAATFGAFAVLVGQTVGLANLATNLSYNATTGALAYDADGAGDGPALNFAILGSGAHPATLGNDFQIVS